MLALYNLPFKANERHGRLLIACTWMHLMHVMLCIMLVVVLCHAPSRSSSFVDMAGYGHLMLYKLSRYSPTQYIILLQSLLTHTHMERQIEKKCIAKILNEMDNLFPHALILITKQMLHSRYISKLIVTQLFGGVSVSKFYIMNTAYAQTNKLLIRFLS